MLGGNDSIYDPRRVGGQIGALETAPKLGDDAVVGDLRPIGERVADSDELVQLDTRVGIEHHLKVARVAAVRAVHQPDPGVRRVVFVLIHRPLAIRVGDDPAIVVAHAASSSRLCCMAASRTARSASRESPSR